jgi:hypothetical protein
VASWVELGWKAEWVGGRLAADGKRNEKRIKNLTELLGLSGRADRENI